MDWSYKRKKIKSVDDFPKDSIGFIYKITNLTNKKVYYGRKTALKKRKKKKLTKKEKSLPENKRKTFKYVDFEYKGWQSYTGSSEELNKDIKKGDKYKKEIIDFCKSKAELTYFEAKAIICNNCLFDDNCYNYWVSARVYKKNLNS